ncbi:MAG: hypothetical protein ACJAV1_001549 [Paraglaciecola sp.]|jgi:hypothetical protein
MRVMKVKQLIDDNATSVDDITQVINYDPAIFDLCLLLDRV